MNARGMRIVSLLNLFSLFLFEDSRSFFFKKTTFVKETLPIYLAHKISCHSPGVSEKVSVTLKTVLPLETIDIQC
jgi:hypothetical protein